MNSYFSSVSTTEDHVNFPTQDCIVDKKLVNSDFCVGPDHIAPCILKSCAPELAPSLTYMVNKSFSIGLLPDEWKQADITPLHKKGPKFSRGNYVQFPLLQSLVRLVKKLFSTGCLNSGVKLTL